MSIFKIIKAIKATLLGPEATGGSLPPERDKKPSSGIPLQSKSKLPSKVWTKEFFPLRQLVLWGWDSGGNPGFLFLYGRHKFNSIKKRRELEENVKYSHLAVFEGKEGHLPSFKAVKIIDPDYFSYGGRDKSPAMYYKRGVRYTWSPDSNYAVRGFRNLEPNEELEFSYFSPESHEGCVERILSLGINLNGFRLAGNPKEVLKLEEQYAGYEDSIVDIMSNPNIYIRKKRLSELLEMKPPREIYARLLQIGSSEVTAGLMLELAKRADPVLVEEAEVLLDSDIKWAGEGYIKGLKRCIRIYLNALDPQMKSDRIKWIRKYLNKMDLNLTGINGKEFPPDKIISGTEYRKYAAVGLMKDTYHKYDPAKRKYVGYEAPRRFEDGPYTDGIKIRLIDFKNTIQEAEIYGLADAAGKIAYYLDAPRLTYYLKGSGRSKALKYFQRYIRRVVDSLAVNDPSSFMEAMKHLLTSYTQYDYVCKFPGNFQFNGLLKHYLYHDFTGNSPTAPNSWYARYQMLANDQLLKAEGRYEYKREIWDKHLETVADIAIGAQIDQVVKACYFILKDSPESGNFIDNISYKQLIGLSLVKYEPLAKMFNGVLKRKIEQMSTFDPELMLSLIDCQDKKLNDMAVYYFSRTNGSFSAETTADMLLMDNLAQWSELFGENLLTLQGEQYVRFVKHIISGTGSFLKFNKALPDNIKDMLGLSSGQLMTAARPEKLEVINGLVSLLSQQSKLPEWLAEFIEELIFSFTYEELSVLLQEASIEPGVISIPSRNRRIFTVLDSIKNSGIPKDNQIYDILDFGTSKMVKMLLDILTNNSEELSSRFSTLLIMLESEITMLNNKAEEVFDRLAEEKQKKLHALIIDSPAQRAYEFGLRKLESIYGEMIPAEFIIQMMEHGSAQVKAFISGKIDNIIDNLGHGNENLFVYYMKTLLLLPNRNSASKDRILKAVPEFVLKYRDKCNEIESILLDIGGSNTLTDSERALVALAKIRGEVLMLESKL